MGRVLWKALAVFACLAPSFAQPLIATKAGIITWSEGAVSLDSQPVERPTPAHPRRIQPNALLHSGRGRAEVMLNPCVVLYLDQNSSLRLLGNDLTDTRLEIVSGSAIVHADGKIRDTHVTLLTGNASLPLAHDGVFRFESLPPLLKVVAGRFVFEREGRRTVVSPGKVIDLADGTTRRFDPRPDSFDLWSDRRVRALIRSSGLADQQQRENAGPPPNTGRGGRIPIAGDSDPAGPAILFPPSPPGNPGRPRICGN